MSRPRKPSSLKLVTGTDRADRRNDQEPEPALLNDLSPPAHLVPRSAGIWRELAPMLRTMQVLTVADVLALELLCDAVGDYRHARQTVGDNFVASTRTGSQMLNQWVLAAQMAGKRAEAFMGKFGMDPVSRSRVMINPQAELFDPPGIGGAADRFFRK